MDQNVQSREHPLDKNININNNISRDTEQEEIKLELDRGPEDNQLTEAWLRYRQFEDFRISERTPLPLSEFIAEWSARLNSAVAAGCEYSDTVLAFKLLERANLAQETVRQVLVRQVLAWAFLFHFKMVLSCVWEKLFIVSFSVPPVPKYRLVVVLRRINRYRRPLKMKRYFVVTVMHTGSYLSASGIRNLC
jgi:hypothetical protein